MKTRRFTLVELLTVITIIAVLAGLAAGGFLKVSEKARIVQTKARMSALQMAIEQYRSTYSYYPFTLISTVDKRLNSGEYEDLIKCLRAADVDLNPRALPMLSADDDTYVDGWEGSYQVALDLDYDGKVDGPEIYGYYDDDAPYDEDEDDIDREVIIWSKGKDGLDSAIDNRLNDDDNDDNVNSWDD